MRLITWNINSVRARIDLAMQLLEEYQPDVLCLQEIKCDTAVFPGNPFTQAGYGHHAVRGFKGHHGVATISKHPISSFETIQHHPKDDGRHILTEIAIPGGAPVHIDNYYVPAGGDVPDREENEKFGHKLDYIADMQSRFAKDKGKERRILVGDLNVAPLPTDVWSHKQLLKVVSHTPIETEAFANMQNALPWVDGVRQIIPEEDILFSWWSYRAKDWRKSNRGRRLDHIWLSEDIKDAISHVEVIDKARDWVKTSDHAPILADFKF